MTAPERPKLLKHLWIWTLLSGIASVILGVLLVLHPFTGVVFAAILLGAYLLVSGIYQVVFAFSMHVSAGGRILMFISGAAALILGVLSFRSFLITGDDATGFLLLAIWVAVGFIFRGVATAASALSDPGMPGRSWEIFFGVISILAGIVVMAWPIRSLALLAWVTGIWLIVSGLLEIASAFSIRTASRRVDDFVERRVAPQGPTP
jgi:uncharacterized membrane protein HdeD (DUF308 family)